MNFVVRPKHGRGTDDAWQASSIEQAIAPAWLTPILYRAILKSAGTMVSGAENGSDPTT
jgi:hypothetical protein